MDEMIVLSESLEARVLLGIRYFEIPPEEGLDALEGLFEALFDLASMLEDDGAFDLAVVRVQGILH